MPFFLLCISCSGDDEENNFGSQSSVELPGSVSEEIISKTEMPSWLAAKVQDIEGNLKPLSQYKIYQGIWKGNTIYHIWSFFSSSVYYETYDQEGSRIDWVKNDFKDFLDTSHDWKLIYTIEEQPK